MTNSPYCNFIIIQLAHVPVVCLFAYKTPNFTLNYLLVTDAVVVLVSGAN